VRGHVVRGRYAITDSLTLAVTYSLTDVIHEASAGDSGAQRLLVDLLWIF
jgi:hypothetical protein